MLDLIALNDDLSASGKIKGTEVNVNITYIARPTSPGVLHGEGKGVIMALLLSQHKMIEWLERQISKQK